MNWLGLGTGRSLRALEKKQNLRQHLLILSIIFVAVTSIYANVTRAYFCAYDDFIEIHRAAFEDTREPSRVFTTSHFNSYKYRPLNRAITLVTYSFIQDNSIFFRIRNVGFHLLNVLLVYTLGWLLFRSHPVSGIGALLFGLHPVANQTIIGAVWGNTIAHAGFLLALVLFIISLRLKRLWRLWLIAGLVTGWLSVLTYDTSITVFGVMCIYLAAHIFLRREASIRWQFIVLFGVVFGALLGSYLLLRRLVVPHGWEQATANLPSITATGQSLSMYLLAILSPVDSVLANEWLHTPLPSEIVIGPSIIIVFGGSALMIASGALMVLWRAHRNSQEIDWATLVFLTSGICLPLLPVLAFQSRPSETYLYLPLAFYGLLISYMVAEVLPAMLSPIGRSTSLAILFVVAGLFAAATWIRNDRVYRCGETARQILFSRPVQIVKEGSWKLSFANIAGEETSRRYGFYGFRGVDVIGGGRSGEYEITRALQLVYRNESLNGEIVQPGELVDKCQSSLSSDHICLWVHSDGRVQRYLN